MLKYVFIVFYLLAWNAGYGQVIINGTINNYDGKTKVYYSPTLEGVLLTTGPSREVAPDGRGKFQIKFNNQGIGTTRIAFGKLFFSFFHDETSKISIVIDQSKIIFPELTMQERLDYEWSGHNHRMDSIKKATLVEIGGDFSDINQFYNTNVRSATITMGVQGNDFSIMIKNASTPSQVESILDSLIQIELSQIERLNEPMLLEKDDYKRVTPEIKKFLVNDVYAFYGSVFLNGMFLKRTEQVSILLQDPEAPYTVYNKDWETLIEAFLKNASKRISPAANSEGYIQFLFNVKHTLDSYQEYDHNPELDYDKLILESLIDPDWSGLDSFSLIDQKAIFVSELQTLMRFLQEQTSYSPVLISAIKEMKKRYPKSGYFDTFDPYIKQVEEYIRSSSEDYNEAIFFEKNYLYFSDLIENLKGKNVLVDIWATWCAPCISDFTYKSILNPFIESEELVILYLSIDKPSWENRWKENIIYNRLKGYHVLANKALIQDVWSFLKGTTGVIPRYALIDKEGDIFLSEAARPSESGLLEEQVRQLINSYKE